MKNNKVNKWTSLRRGHHAHNTTVGRGCVWQGVQRFHCLPAMGTGWRLVARAQACHCREGTLLGYRLWPPCLSQHDAQRDPHPLPGGDLWKSGRPKLYVVTLKMLTVMCGICFKPVFLYVFVFRGGTQWMVLLTHCCPLTAGHGVTWPGWILNRSTALSCPPVAGSGRETGMWIRAVEENPARPGWEPTYVIMSTHMLLISVLPSVFSVWNIIFLLQLFPHYWGSVSPQGWEYAVDFPANFSPDKKWNSCVRRRRWIRYRRYIAQGTWAKVWTLTYFLWVSD